MTPSSASCVGVINNKNASSDIAHLTRTASDVGNQDILMSNGLHEQDVHGQEQML